MGKSGKIEKQKRHFWQKKEQKTTQDIELLEKEKPRNGDLNDREQNAVDGFVPPDGGWGWVVCLASLWANGTVFGVINTFGLVYVEMREHYAKDDPEVSLKTAFVGSTCTGVTFLLCTVSSILSDRVGIRTTAVIGAVLSTAGLIASAFIQKLELLYLTYGILLGLGSSMVYSPSLVILGHYFKKHMGLVNGIVAFGSSLFTIALTRILPLLLSTIGIKYCFIFLAGLHFMLIIFSLSWKPLFRREDHLTALTLSTESVYNHCNDCCSWTRKFLNVKIWKNKAYVTWVLSLGVALFGYFIPFFHLPKHTRDNFPESDGSLLILCLSITSGVSRIVCGKIADFPWVNRIRMQQCAFFVLGVSTMCIPFAKSFEALIAISLAMGLCDGVFVCLLGPVAFDIVGPSEASQAIGFLLGIFSIPFTIGPPVAGFMYDKLGDYRIAFHVAGAPPILGALMMFLIPKVDQSFPAVTEAMEFASVSMMDVYKEVRVPSHKLGHTQANGAPSGPYSELQLITSQELLVIGSKYRLPSGDNEDEPDEHTTAAETKPDGYMEDETMQKTDVSREEAHLTQSINEPQEKYKSSKDISSEQDEVLPMPAYSDFNESNANDDKESSLLTEIGKFFDGNKISFDSNEKTSV
ncbi:monocarboxylate transporter 10-like isoform X2 [Mya arenaria]|uniref:monocarboxylate transporter 10-like isoform X2 n=1 Tax=Mya arenaria TaxID=6604 RepID=UPI0022DED312|nr:monocarboxylate transporter 10-like isoform X2 [Mya arenaria]